jgi:diguanylate cyclase (GGDEF)-like protein
METAPQEQDEKKPVSGEDILFRYLRDLIYDPLGAVLDPDQLPPNLQKLGKGLKFYAECVAEAMTLARELSKGEMNGYLPSRSNELAAPLKALQASLRHLAWQTQQVAKGDYKQRVSFMGDFADAFNSMIEQLDQRRVAVLQEIELNIRKSEALAQSNSLLEAITRNISQWIVVIDRESEEWLFVNRDIDTLINVPEFEPELCAWLAHILKEAPDGHIEHIVEMELRDDVHSQFFSVVVHPLNWHERDAVAFVFTDVSANKRHLHRLENVAYHDALTKTFNRHYGMEVLTEWLSMGMTFALCFVDIDNLKFVNDKYGHAEGDKYILRIVDMLRNFERSAAICRLGGDEFMLLAENFTAHEAETRLKELRDKLINMDNNPECFYHHSLSYGVVEVSIDNTMSASELLSIADEKMYRFKRKHKMQRQTMPAE